MKFWWFFIDFRWFYLNFDVLIEFLRTFWWIFQVSSRFWLNFDIFMELSMRFWWFWPILEIFMQFLMKSWWIFDDFSLIFEDSSDNQFVFYDNCSVICKLVKNLVPKKNPNIAIWMIANWGRPFYIESIDCTWWQMQSLQKFVICVQIGSKYQWIIFRFLCTCAGLGERRRMADDPVARCFLFDVEIIELFLSSHFSIIMFFFFFGLLLQNGREETG